MSGRESGACKSHDREWEASLKSTYKDLACVDLPSQRAHVGPIGSSGEEPRGGIPKTLLELF